MYVDIRKMKNTHKSVFLFRNTNRIRTIDLYCILLTKKSEVIFLFLQDEIGCGVADEEEIKERTTNKLLVILPDCKGKKPLKEYSNK